MCPLFPRLKVKNMISRADVQNTQYKIYLLPREIETAILCLFPKHSAQNLLPCLPLCYSEGIDYSNIPENHHHHKRKIQTQNLEQMLLTTIRLLWATL